MPQTGELLDGQSGLPVDNPTKSYWHREPSEKLLDHRTTKELPRSADVVIVGSGITGSFAAHFLKEKRPDLNVVMLEAREACWGATGRNGGHCQPAIYAAQAHIASFELRNFAYLKALVEDLSIPCDWRSTSGVHAFYSAPLFAEVRRVVDDLAGAYPDLAANVAVVTRGEGEGESGKGDGLAGTPAYLLEGERRELTLGGLRVPGAEGAVVQWNAASLWPYKLVAFVLERLLAANGAGAEAAGSFNLQTNTPATGLSAASPPASLSSPGGSSSTTASPVWTVHTPRGTVSAPRVLLATNAYTSHLLPSFADLIVPTRGQVSALKPPEQQPAAPSDPPLDIGHTYYIVGEPDNAMERDDYLVQRPPPPAELVFGGGRRHAKGRGVGVWDDGSVDEPVAWYLRGELGSVLDLSLHSPSSKTEGGGGSHPTVKKQDLEPTYEWTGIMGYSRDGHPFVGRVPSSLGGGPDDDDADVGLYVCAGYTGHGMPNAVLSAKAAVDMMYGDGDGDGAEVDLPPEYELTEQRVAAARRGDEVAVVDSKGTLYADFGHLL
ncbi:FAD dependent oxidoreductase [Hypoxylon rubiginosum]|uniref:FAD dependent oxidoreductase n=1 Tax=Hypoxylon rubiginosum TaxID=110542 RepID=A0ACB9YUP8_9PEZI|nr:FAD dependent oxidoreductase [Hypoxylon rubiginosum]